MAPDPHGPGRGRSKAPPPWRPEPPVCPPGVDPGPHAGVAEKESEPVLGAALSSRRSASDPQPLEHTDSCKAFRKDWKRGREGRATERAQTTTYLHSNNTFNRTLILKDKELKKNSDLRLVDTKIVISSFFFISILQRSKIVPT